MRENSLPVFFPVLYSLTEKEKQRKMVLHQENACMNRPPHQWFVVYKNRLMRQSIRNQYHRKIAHSISVALYQVSMVSPLRIFEFQKEKSKGVCGHNIWIIHFLCPTIKFLLLRKIFFLNFFPKTWNFLMEIEKFKSNYNHFSILRSFYFRTYLCIRLLSIEKCFVTKWNPNFECKCHTIFESTEKLNASCSISY